jgi:hypothetical protein
MRGKRAILVYGGQAAPILKLLEDPTDGEATAKLPVLTGVTVPNRKPIRRSENVCLAGDRGPAKGRKERARVNVARISPAREVEWQDHHS